MKKIVALFIVVALLAGGAFVTASAQINPIGGTCHYEDNDGNIIEPPFDGTEIEVCVYKTYLNLLGNHVTPSKLYQGDAFPCQGPECPPTIPGK